MMKLNESLEIQDEPLIKSREIQDEALHTSPELQAESLIKALDIQDRIQIKSRETQDQAQIKSPDEEVEAQIGTIDEHDDAHIETHNEEDEAPIERQNEQEDVLIETQNEQEDVLIETQNEQNEEQPIYPVSTLVQSVGNRHFELHIRTIHNIQLLILTFPRGLTLLMSALADNIPSQPGLAQLDVHRKFLPVYGKYLHWITFTFPQIGTKVKAQIMLETRLEAACQMIDGGACACFLNNPLRTLRRSRNTRPRQQRSSR